MLLRVRHRCPGVALLALLACASAACAPPTRPDVLLIVVDTLRADRLGSYGYAHPTPAMDALADGSVVFENAIASSARTAPSMASLFTSLPPSRHGVTHQGAALPPGPPTLAEVFARGGYRTALVSASADLVDPALGLARGFEVVELELPLPADRSPAADPALHRDRVVTREAIEQLNAWQQGDAPWFVVVHFMGPHPPYDAKKRDKRPGTRRYRGVVDGSLEQLAAIARGELVLDVVDQVHLSALYDAKVQGVDEQVGELLGHMRRRGWLDDTLVALTGDHGEALRGDAALFHGTNLYREQLHVPLLVHRPGGRGAGERVARVVGLVDVGPTLLALAGLPDTRDATGASLVGVMEGGDESAGVVVSELHPDPAWSRVWGKERHRRAVTTDGWTLLEGPTPGSFELYARDVDPGEEDDRAAQRPEIVERLAAALADDAASAPAGE